jgi:AhpD family alkylhydroperoxidase
MALLFYTARSGAPSSAGRRLATTSFRDGGIVTKPIDEFNEYRRDMNKRILSSDHLGIKRFFALDHLAYEGGALDAKTKELLGLVASLVLRCDDCITYHVLQCVEEGVTRDEFLETFNVGLVVGGSIVIPHMRRAFERMDEALETKRVSD